MKMSKRKGNKQHSLIFENYKLQITKTQENLCLESLAIQIGGGKMALFIHNFSQYKKRRQGDKKVKMSLT